MKLFAALVLEQGRSTFKLYLVAITVACATCLGAYLFLIRNGSATREDAKTYAGAAIGGLHVAHLLWLMFLLFASGDDDDLRLSMPRYLMRLPVSAWNLVAARLSFGILSTMALGLLGTVTFYGLFDADMEKALPFRMLVMIYPTIYAVLQSIVWCVGPAGIGTTVGVVLFGSLIPSGIFFDFEYTPYNLENYSLPGIGAAMMISFMAAGIVVAQHRKGRFSSLAVIPALLTRRREDEATDSSIFASKEAALRWYEYRRQWRLFPRILVLGFLVFFFLIVITDDRPTSVNEKYEIPWVQVVAIYAERILITLMSTLIMGTALCAGVFLFRGWRPLFTKDRSFLFVRPVTVKALTASRWEAGARTVAITLLPVIAIVTVVMFLDMRHGRYNPETGTPFWDNTFALLADALPTYQIVLVTVLAFASLIAAVWSGLWLENIFMIGGVFAIVAFGIENIPAFAEMEPVTRANLEFRVTAGIVFLGLAFLAFINLRRRLISRKHLVTALCLTPAFGLGYYFYLNTNQFLEQRPVEEIMLTTFVPLFMLAVVAPLLTTPLITQWARHRK